jgi:hypothetical protein
MTKKPLIARDTGQPLVVMGWAAQELKRLFVLHGHRLTFVTVRRARDRNGNLRRDFLLRHRPPVVRSKDSTTNRRPDPRLTN